MEHPAHHPHPRAPRFARTVLACALGHAFVAAGLVTTVILPGAAQAANATATAPAPGRKIYDIPAGPLEAALNRLGREAGILLSFPTALTDGLQSKGLRGSYTVQEALPLLLQGTGLAVVAQANGGYSLVKLPDPSAAATTPAAQKEALLPVVKVNASTITETATGPLTGYVARRSAAGTKTDTPIIETPQSISVVGSQQMQHQKAQTLQDALGYSAGVMTGIVGINPLIADTLALRGFSADPQFGNFYRDGMRYMVNIYNGKQEPYGLERVEVLKGPASVLYGAAAPGGVVNTVTKRPTLEPLREINAEYGSHDRKQLSADFGGPLDTEDVWSYRLTALARDSGTFVDYGRDDRTYIAPALMWRPSAATSLTFLGSYQHSDASYPALLPATGTLLPNPNGRIERNPFLGEPSLNAFDNSTTTLGYFLEHRFSDALKIRHSLRRFQSDLMSRYVLVTSDVDRATQRTVARSARGFDDDTSILTSDTSLETSFPTGPLNHTVLTGIDYTRSKKASDRVRGNLGRIDVYAPVYTTTSIQTSPWRQFRDNERRLGLYLQDQVKIGDKWVFLAGGRHDRIEVESLSLHAPADNTDESDSAFTGRAGIVYLADNGLAPYASFSQSFEPTSGRDRFNQRFKPSKGEQFELGVRFQPKGSNTMLSASLFQLTRQNVLTPDAADTDFSVQTGEVRSRGLELEAKTTLGRGLDLIAAYTYTDARTTASTIPAAVDEKFNGTPSHLLSLWADANLAHAGLPGWRAGVGVRYVSARPDQPSSDSLGGPAYTLVDARLGYEDGPWSYTVNATNLTDKIYVPALCVSGRCDYGAPRSVVATVSYRW